MIRARLAVFVFVFTALAGEVSDAAVINGSYMVNPTTDQIGIVNDLPSITNLVLREGVPQTSISSVFSPRPRFRSSLSMSASASQR